MNPRRVTRLKNDYEEIKSTFAKDKFVDIVAMGALPPEKYRLVYRLPSMHIDQFGNPISVNTTVVDIELPMDYPRVPPIAKTAGGDVVFHPNMDSSKICLMDRWHPAAQIVDLIRDIGDMLQWKRFNIRSPLNAFAAEWSQTNSDKIPLGTKELGTK